MATKTLSSSETTVSATYQTDSSKHRLYQKWDYWRSQNRIFWPEIQKWQEMYEFFKREGSETIADVSLNTAFAIIESMVSQMNDSKLQVDIKAHGNNDCALFERYLGHIVESAILDKGVARFNMPFRKIKEVVERDYLVKGNFVAEVGYMYIKDPSNNLVLADNASVQNRSLYSIAFDPSKTLLTSEEYFVEKYTTYAWLKAREKDPKTGKGTYINLKALKDYIEVQEWMKTRTIQDQNWISGDAIIPRVGEGIQLVEYWKGAHLTVIANGMIVVRDEDDPLGIGTHSLLLGMNYVVEGRPYGYGEIAAIYKSVRAQDTIVNQRIETINQSLRPTVFVHPDSGIDLDQVAAMLEDGGVGYGDPAMVKTLDKPNPASTAYTETSDMQQAIERTARFSPYNNGSALSSDDKTQGTKGGILALQGAAQPNFQVKVDGITDMFLTPLGQKYLPLLARHMTSTDIRYGAIEGEDRPWVGATKNILLGTPTLKDMLTVGMITQPQYDSFTTTPILGPDGQPIPAIDPQSGQPAQNPDGSPAFQTKSIPGAGAAHMVEVDWMVSVSLDMRSAHDRQARLQNMQNMISYLQNLGVHFSPSRTAAFFENKMDEVKGLSGIILTPQELQQQSSEMPREALKVMINLPDLPPTGQVQAAAQAGITITPDEINAVAANKAAMTHSTQMDGIALKAQGVAMAHHAKAAAEAPGAAAAMMTAPPPLASSNGAGIQ